MYIVIRGSGMLFGIFSSKKLMKEAIECAIEFDKQKNGTPCGNFNFRYIKANVDEPYFSKNLEYSSEIGRALFSLSTMHDEYFPNKVETDWTTGKIIKI